MAHIPPLSQPWRLLGTQHPPLLSTSCARTPAEVTGWDARRARDLPAESKADLVPVSGCTHPLRIPIPKTA